MKNNIKILSSIALLCLSVANAQVGIGTTTPAAGAALDITSTNKGLLLPRVPIVTSVTSPVNGMMVYEIANDCVRTYENGAWSNCFNGSVTIPSILSNTGKIWMDRNLGATRAATSATDHLAYGDIYQWGRKADGHEKITWTGATTGTPVNSTTTSNADVPANNLFILESSSPFNWRLTGDSSLWNGVGAINNPCPPGFRLPTYSELTSEVTNTSTPITNTLSAYSNPLKFTAAGFRNNITGVLTDVGVSGHYWTSTGNISQLSARYIFLANSVVGGSGDAFAYRALGYSVRCIKY